MYLSRVEISDFRAFPPDFMFDLMPGPGVTLLVGQNGLGKSTFIEAIEWCLTGGVRRLTDLQDGRSRSTDFLRRRSPDGTQANEYFVQLTYASEPTVQFRRHTKTGLTSPNAATAPTNAEVISALKAENWKEPITDVSTYLRLTHFLSQSVDQRFAARGSDERWQALAAPAGSERLNAARERLGGRGLTLAFNERIEASELAVTNAISAEGGVAGASDPEDRTT